MKNNYFKKNKYGINHFDKNVSEFYNNAPKLKVNQPSGSQFLSQTTYRYFVKQVKFALNNPKTYKKLNNNQRTIIQELCNSRQHHLRIIYILTAICVIPIFLTQLFPWASNFTTLHNIIDIIIMILLIITVIVIACIIQNHLIIERNCIYKLHKILFKY